MCFNEQVSFATFSIGTVLNLVLALVFKNRFAISMALVWQFVLLMQLFEGITWMGEKKKKKQLKEIGVKGSFISNVLQPVAVFLVLVTITKQKNWYLPLMGTLTILYLAYVIYVQPQIQIEVGNEECPHLKYVWWEKISGVVYVVLLSLLLALASPARMYLPQLGFVLATLVIAMSTKLSCGVASTWCFLAASAPVFTIAQMSLMK